MQNIFDSAVQITDTEITDTEGGDFVHKGTSKSGESCPRGKVVQFVDDDGNVTYLCKHCKRTWIGRKLDKFDSAVQITDTEITDTEGGDFVHKGTSKSGESCPRGKVVQFLDDDGNVTYLCKHCKRTWIGESLGV